MDAVKIITKKTFFFTLGLVLTTLANAGDVAVFVDKGFSSDCKTYLFSQYGKTDVDYFAWAELFTVDVPSNTFVEGGYSALGPDKSTKELSGKQAYDTLMTKSQWNIAKYDPKNLGSHTLYVMEDEKRDATQKIEFQDFASSTLSSPVTYEVSLVSKIEDKGASFYIDLTKHNSSGDVVLKKKIGHPDTIRKGVDGYRIARIIEAPDASALIFVIEKHLPGKNGPSIRYMVETCAL